MGEGLSFIAIRKDKAEEAPEAVKKFTKDFCTTDIIFGIECYVAIGSDYGKCAWYDMHDEEYQEGLTQDEIDDCGIWTWFDNNPEIVFNYDWM